MARRTLDIPPLFKYPYQLFREHASFIIGVMSTYFVLGMIPQFYLFIYTPKDPNFEHQLITIIALLVQLFFALGFTKIMLYLVDDRDVDINDLINNGRIFFSYAVAYFIYYIIVIIGIILIIPGIYFAIRLQFYPYYIIEHGDHSFLALQKSWYATKEMALELFVFGACVLILNALGAVFFGIGVIFTYPITTMATAVVFKGIEEDAEQIPTPPYQP